jgi:hypothetical protein
MRFPSPLRPLIVCSCLLSLIACGKVSTQERATPPKAGVLPAASAPSIKPPTAAAPLEDLSPMGLPLYPTVFESAWTGNFGTDKEAARIGQMSSHDSFDKVYAWYHEHMPAGTEPSAAAASNHTTDEGDRMAVFQTGETSDATMSRVMVLRGKADDYTIINLATHVTR